MPPIRLYTNWNQRSVDHEEQKEPYRKYFFICEGANTEVWYFKQLIDLRKQLGIHPLIDIRLMEKTGEDANRSNPQALLAFAEEQKKLDENQFDDEHDKMVIVFDADIYKKNPKRFAELYHSGAERNILAITNPSFELFLLLHFERSYEEDILPHEQDILENKKIGKRRYITALFTEKSGMNPKGNPEVGKLAAYVSTAIEQEKHLNQNPENALDCLTCNVGKIIGNIIQDRL